ncbi:AAA family ATPase [Streptomyces sp. NPDC054841]
MLYQASESNLGFRCPLPDEASPPSGESAGGTDGLSVEHALHGLIRRDRDPLGLQQRLIAAWIGRAGGIAAPCRPALVLVGGYAGSGKTELAHVLSQHTGWLLLDRDPVTRPLIERLLIALGSDANDRESDVYRKQVRPVEYERLMTAGISNLTSGCSTVLTAPFLAEMTDTEWMDRLTSQCGDLGADLFPVWVQCDKEWMRKFIHFRSADRDAQKLTRWDEYLSTVDVELRPSVPHVVIDNRHGAAMRLADRARHALRRTAAHPGRRR